MSLIFSVCSCAAERYDVTCKGADVNNILAYYAYVRPNNTRNILFITFVLKSIP